MDNENQNIEYKRIWKDEYLKWVCGFANAHGGRIYVGIDDDRTIVGVSHLHDLLEDIPNKIVTTIGIMPEINHLVREGKDIIEIAIEPCGMPVSYHGAYYYRSGATKQELRGVALHQFLLRKMGLNWEDIQCPDVTIDDLDDEAIAYFLKKGIRSGRVNPDAMDSDKVEVLSNLGLLSEGVPTNAAVLLFGRHPQRKFVTSGFKIGRFGTSDADLRSQDVVEGNLIQMADRIMQVLSDKYLIRPIRYEGMQRIEPLELPEEALREMIFNSIVHKLQSGTWNQMSIYDDHIRLWNEGTLPEGYTVETLLGKHTSKPRNPKIANVFYKAGFIESWGRGYEKIMQAFDAEGLSRPELVEEQGGVSVLILRERFAAVSRGEAAASGSGEAESKEKTNQNQAGSEPNSGKNSEKHAYKANSEALGASQNRSESEPNQAGCKSKSKEKGKEKSKEKLLELVRRNPQITSAELQRLLGLSRSGVERIIRQFKGSGIIRRIGPDKGGSWQIVPSGAS